MARGRDSRDEAAKPRYRAPPGPVPTLGQLRQTTCWIWLYCNAPGCHASVAVALAPLIIRLGPDASSDVLRRSARCSKCGGKGATLMLPSWGAMQMGLVGFPVEIAE